MAGSLYLGSQKVCPSMLVVREEPTSCVFRVPDNVTNISKTSAFGSLYGNLNPFPYDLAIDLNNVEEISGDGCFEYTFGGCNIVSLKEKIKTISARQVFSVCFAFANIPEDSTLFENLESVSSSGLNSALMYSTGKQTYRFKKLNYIENNGFEACFGRSSAKHIYFNSLKSDSFDTSGAYYHFESMLMGVTGCTLHFPSNLSSVIPTLDTYPNFGGTNTVILYDLEATE